MADMTPPTVTPRDDDELRQLKQVTVKSDEEIEAVNQLLGDGWRLVTVSHRSDAMVYVLGRSERRQRARTGFLPAV